MLSLDLDEISLWVFESRVGEPVLKAAVVGEKEQPLAVAVEPADGVDVGDVDEVGQRRVAGAGGQTGDAVTDDHTPGFAAVLQVGQELQAGSPGFAG